MEIINNLVVSIQLKLLLRNYKMIRDIYQNYKINKEFKINIDAIEQQLINVRKNSDFLIFTPKPTQNSWRGVYNGAIAFSELSTFAFPQYYSNCLYNDNELNTISEIIYQLKFRVIVYSGYLPYFDKIIKQIHFLNNRDSTKLKQLIIYHGSFSTNREDNKTTTLLKNILNLNKKGFIDKIGFVKKGMSESLETITGLNCEFLIPITKKISSQKIKNDFSDIKIGVLTHDLYRKNIDNQIAASLMIKEAIIVIQKNYNYSYFFSDDRFLIKPFFESYDDHLNYLRQLSLNMYVSFSECFGLVISESLSMGVPCLVSNCSGILDYNLELKELLTVDEYDNSNAIYKKALNVIENSEYISKMGIEYIDLLNEKAKKLFDNFIS